MYLFTAEQMRQVDAAAVKAGIPSLLLMENAGQKVAERVLEAFPQCQHILVLCGKGNNGGDGYVLARHLLAARKTIQILEVSSEPSSSDSQTMRAAYLAQDEAQLAALQREHLAQALEKADLVVDALLGSGLTRAVEGLMAELISMVNQHAARVVAVDIPSGVGADRGLLSGPHIQADLTVQLAGAKVASAFYPARSAFGQSAITPIGIPQRLLRSDLILLDEARVSADLPQPRPEAHKYQTGTVLAIAGSEHYTGAAELCCRAALRAGAGLVTLASQMRHGHSWPEIIFQPLDQLSALDDKRANARVIGPGLIGLSEAMIIELIRSQPAPTVIDASALVSSTDWFEAVREQGQCVLTPHLGEAAGLLADEPSPTEKPIEAARSLAKKSQAIVVLKGASTVIATADGMTAVSTRGHPGMATGGSGDALAGLIAAFLATEGDTFKRVCAAVIVHGLAGELAAHHKGVGLTPSDLIAHIPLAMKQLRHS